MATNRDIVGKVRSLLKLSSTDFLISDRLILSVLLPVNKKLVCQQLTRRIGASSPNLFTTIPCLPMTQVPISDCCEIQGDGCMISRSKDQLPDIVDTYYGLAIDAVKSVDKKAKKFNELNSPDRYNNILKIYPNNKDKYYFFFNKYLYVTDPDIEVIYLSAFFSDVVDPDQFSSCGNADRSCPVNKLDLEWKSLPKLEDDIVKMTMEEILTTYRNINGDNTSNAQEGT